jgi:hypothetical protein
MNSDAIDMKTNEPKEAGTIVYRSGNPGYESNSIVFVSKGHIDGVETNAYDLKFGGF